MADEVETPAAETPDTPEVEGTPLFDEAEFAPDPSQPVFVEPGSIDEQGNEVSTPSEVEEVVEAPEASEEPETPVETPAPEVTEVTIDDPGDFVAKDYSFDVTVYDEEGKNGRTVKVKSIDDYDKLLEADSNFGSAASLMKANRLASKMENNQDRDRQAYESKKAEYDEAVESDKQRVDTLNRWQAEADYLVASGELPAMEPGDKDANWRDPEVAAKPGVKAQIELLNWMTAENQKLEAAGVTTYTSLRDAFNARELQTLRTAGKQRADKAGQARKSAGAKVAGTQPNPVAAQPKGVMVGRSFGDLSNLSSTNWGGE